MRTLFQIPLHAGEPGPAISFGVPWTSYHEGEVGADERLVPVQRKGAHLVTQPSKKTIRPLLTRHFHKFSQ